MDLAVQPIPQVNTVHLPQDPTDLVVLLPLSTEFHQLLLDLVVLLLPSTVLLQPQADLEVLLLLPDMVPLRHQADLVVVLLLPDTVLLRPLAGSVVVLLLQNMVLLHPQADLVVRPSIAMATLWVPRDLVDHLRINMALQFSVAMVVLHQHSMVPLRLWDDLEVSLQINMELLLHLAVMVALFPPSTELLHLSFVMVALLPPSTKFHPRKTNSVVLLRLSTAPLHLSVVLPLLNTVHHLTVDLAAFPLPNTVVLPAPAGLGVPTEQLDHPSQILDMTTLEDAMDNRTTTFL